ncbi:MAG: sulfotransferase family protein [Actinomycetota bacterium]|nr:sulfotransferase family protein [Actinomycetota bacterium]
MTAGAPTVVFVLGMSRSGTSAMARVVSLCGAALPSGLIGGMPANPLGFWEPRRTWNLNRAILRRHGSAWADPTLRLQERPFTAKQMARYISRAQAFFDTLPDDPLVVIKDLQITALPDIWFEAARRAGYDIAVLIALRHPQEVIDSHRVMMKERHASPELIASNWLKYTLLAERQTRHLRRVVVDYGNLLKNWRREMERISAALNVEFSPDSEAIDGYLREGERHHCYEGPMPQPFGMDWMATTYRTLHRAANDDPWSTDDLDRVFGGYRASEHTFRIAVGSFERMEKGNLLMSPVLTRIALEGMAITHRRRGAWA